MTVPINYPFRSLVSHLFQRVARVIEHHLICLNEVPVGVKDHDKLRKEIYKLAQLSFVLAQRFLRLFALVNISKQRVPADNTAFRVPQGESTNMEPAVYAILAPATLLDVVRLPSFN